MSRKEIKEWKWSDFGELNQNQIKKKAEQIIKVMSLEEKAWLMSGDKAILSVVPMLIHYNKNPIPAGVLGNLNIPGILFADGPRGVVLNHSTCFPVSMARGASWDVELEEKIGNVIGIEAKSQGANFFGGVCINLLRHPAWGRAQETYGEDPYHLGEMGVALMKGVQNHIMACAKHYACNSIENTRFKLNVNIDERTLREVYLPHFKKCVDQNIASIMNAYNKVNGEYCGHNEHLLREILKNEWNFQGFVITDFVYGIRNGKKAIQAGVDIEMPYKWKMRPKKIIKWVKKGDIPEEYIDDSVCRIISQEIRFAKNQNSELYNKDKIASQTHTNLALEAARKSIVLLKNSNEILPLQKNDIKKIAIIGDLANTENLGDKGSSRVYPPYVITPLQGIKNEVGDNIKVIYDEGRNPSETIDNVKDSDAIIIVVGFTHKDEGENMTFGGGDRDSLTLKPKDEKLILKLTKSFDNCIVIMEGGSAIITEKWRQRVPAIIMAWYPGMEGGTALAEIIFGNTNPSGKLPIVFPKSLDQLPYFDAKTKEIEYGYYHGYRLMEKEGYEPAFPFGFGLSYTSYKYDNLKIHNNKIHKEEDIMVSIDITNTGKIEGEEVVQLYVGYPNSTIERPKKELKGFSRIILSPQETKNISFSVKPEELAYYDSKEKKWIIEDGQYIVYVGSSSQRKDLLKQTFTIS
ncbi:MAG: glycosyl hydrolase [Promethearchaeota archaeon]|nr:MAG: glycosyl hydrolase [Candidatus Lokiarchaeota archaeon]